MPNKKPLKQLTLRTPIAEIHVHGWTWRTAGAVFGLCGGIFSSIVGSILTAIAWFIGPEWHKFSLHREGTVLLFLTIPLLIFGAHCLDLIDKQQASKPSPRLGKRISN